MATYPLLNLVLLFTFLLAISEGTESRKTSLNGLKTYIVHVKKPAASLSTPNKDLKAYHQSFLPFIRLKSLKTEEPLLYSYQNVVSGFAARLTDTDIDTMKKKHGFVSAHEERILKLQTTHTPAFLGLHQESGFWKDSNYGKATIIGVLDTGITPDHPSFSDHGVPPPPSKWKGRCEFINASTCNNKIIGARSFTIAATALNITTTPIDELGHGTHTASTAAGGFVKNAAAVGGAAAGTAVGMAPYAHLAIYKVCSHGDCPESDILAGLDAAVGDGVDVISISLGFDDKVPFYRDNIAIASFAAMQKGIFVSCAAGNSGPSNSTVINGSPWVLTVGASTTDRKIKVTARLGNKKEFDGESLFQPKDFTRALLPLVYAGANGKKDSKLCVNGSLEGMDVKGKVVLCERGVNGRIEKGEVVKEAGGEAMILMNQEEDGFSLYADAHVLPATHVSYAAGIQIKSYINSTFTVKPVARLLFKGTVIGDPFAPSVASFSSRGPNTASPGILKPDVIGPGVSILAALGSIGTKPRFEMLSGTSMACPHLSGVAALLKATHPYWTPAAIKSAIMTSADVANLKGTPIVDETLQAADPFGTGAGHVDPSKANDPGLIYDIEPDDYVHYLCGLGYSDEEVGIIAHQQPIKCLTESSIPEGYLNYPSFAVKLGLPQTFTRTVTNVGDSNASYVVRVNAPKGVSVSVNPNKMSFTKMNQKATYSVTFSRVSEEAGEYEYSQGCITWVSGKYMVRSVISVNFITSN